MAEYATRKLLFADKELWLPRNGGKFHSSITPPECWEDIDAFQARPTDICIATYPRSGSHWMRRIISLLLGFDNRDFIDLPIFENVTHQHPPQRMGYQVLAKKPTDSPRIIITHLPATHLPKSFWNTEGVKIVFMLRNPFDVFRSGFRLVQNVDGPMSFSTFLDVILDAGTSEWSGIARTYWERRHQKNLLFVYYEDLKENFRQTVTSLANFLEISVSPEKLDMIQERSSLGLMRTIEAEGQKITYFGLESLCNKGLSNEAIKEYSDEEVALIKSKIKEKLADTDIRYVKEIL